MLKLEGSSNEGILFERELKHPSLLNKGVGNVWKKRFINKESSKGGLSIQKKRRWAKRVILLGG